MNLQLFLQYYISHFQQNTLIIYLKNVSKNLVLQFSVFFINLNQFNIIVKKQRYHNIEPSTYLNNKLSIFIFQSYLRVYILSSFIYQLKLMKVLLTALTLLIIVSASDKLSISLEKQPSQTHQIYQIIATGGDLPYRYLVRGLPSGGQIIENKIVLSSNTSPGKYKINVKVLDSSGESIDKVYTLQITSLQQTETNGQNSFTNTNGNFQSINRQSSGSIERILGKVNQSNKNGFAETSQSKKQLSNQIANSRNPNNIQSSQTSSNNVRDVASARNNLQLLDQILNKRNINLITKQSNISTNSQVINKPSQTKRQSGAIKVDPMFDPLNSLRIFNYSRPSNTNSINSSSISTSNANSINRQSSNPSIPSQSNERSQTKPSSTSGSTNQQANTINRIQQPTSSQMRTSAIISSYSMPRTNLKTPQYQDNIFPQIKFPTGTTPSAINTTPLKILTTNTPPSQRNRVKITSNQIILQTSSQRHQIAVKAVTNLLAIIDRSRAKKDLFQKLTNQLNTQLDNALKIQRNNQNDINQIDVTINQINLKIQSTIKQLTGLEGKLEETKNQRDNLLPEKKNFQNRLSTLQNNRVSVTNQFNNLNNELKGTQKNLFQKNSICQNYTTQIQTNRKSISNLEDKADQLDKKITNLTDDIRKKQNIVDDLQRKLNAAIADRDSAQKDLNIAQISKSRIPPEITSLKNLLQRLQAEDAKCQTQIKQFNSKIENLKIVTSRLNSRLDDINNNINQSKVRLTSLNAQIKSLEDSGPNQVAKINDLQNQLGTLKTQLNVKTGQRKSKQSDDNQASNKVNVLKQDFDLAKKRLAEQIDTINRATLNLEIARAQQALARKAFEQITYHYSGGAGGILPQTIVPNGGGKTFAGNPKGNNPSGSPLGIVSQDEGRSGDSLSIDNWGNYLSQTFGLRASSVFPKSVNRLFPFTFSSQTTLNAAINSLNIRQDSQCDYGTPSRTLTGRIEQIRDDSLYVRYENGRVSRVTIYDCTKLYSNISNYRAQIGEIVIVKGSQLASGSIIGQNILCLV